MKHINWDMWDNWDVWDKAGRVRYPTVVFRNKNGSNRNVKQMVVGKRVVGEFNVIYSTGWIHRGEK